MEISDTKFLKLEEGMVDNIEKLWSEWIGHDKYFSIGLILMLLADSISQRKANEMRDSGEWIGDDFDFAFADEVVANKSVGKVTALQYSFGGEVDI